MPTVYRVDRGPIVGTPERTDAGFLRVPAQLTRIGVFTYHLPDGTTCRELRGISEVSAVASLETLRGAPVTDGHPAGMVTAENSSQLVRGHVHDDIRMDGDFVAATLTIEDAALIERIETGKARELSCGYKCDLEPAPGIWNGLAYDAIQHGIRYNHVAVVERGRAGPEARLKMDAGETVYPDPTPPEEDPPMPAENTAATVRVAINGVTYDVSPEVATALGVEHGHAKTKLDAEKARADAAEGRADAADEKAKASDKSRTDAETDMPRLVAERLALIAQASPHLDAETVAKLPGMDHAAIRLAIVTAAYPEAKLDGKTPDYIAGRYDGALEVLEGKADSAEETAKAVIGAGKADGKPAEGTPDAARARMIEANRKASQGG